MNMFNVSMENFSCIELTVFLYALPLYGTNSLFFFKIAFVLLDVLNKNYSILNLKNYIKLTVSYNKWNLN